jgi:hypothetical protein
VSAGHLRRDATLLFAQLITRGGLRCTTAPWGSAPAQRKRRR